MLGEERLAMEDRIAEIRDNIHKAYPEVPWPEPVMEPVFRGRLKKVAIPERKAIFDLNTGNTWDIVSDVYDLVTHEEILWNMLQAVPEEYGKPKVSVRLWQDAARFRADISFPEVARTKFEIRKGDPIAARISGYSSYDRSTYQGIVYGAEQLVCTNGAVAFVTEGAKRRKHIITSTITREELMEEINTYLVNFSDQADIWRQWAERQLGKTEFEDVIGALPFSDPEREKLLELPLMNDENGRFLKQIDNPTLWDVHSAATQYAKHEVRGVQRSIDLEEQIAAVLSRV